MTAPLVLLLALLGIGSLPAPRPRLVVVITVDQLRPDYLDRYRSQLTGGLALLLKQGAVFTEAYQDHAVTETAPGHSTILSGRWPAHTGIVRNTAGVQDSTAPLVGVTGLGASPARFRGTALFDWLKAAEPGARALSVSGKDRGAILPLGRAKEQVYWYAGGYFTTSRYYADSLPEWVRVFNGRRIPFKAAGANWNLLLPARAYPEPDSEPYENSGKDFTFPHRLSPDSARAALEYLAVPSMDSLTLAFALEGVRALGLGSRGAVDLLSVSLSTTDYVGHAYGPDSREIHDQVVRLDRSLGLFLQQLFVRYGSGGVLIVLTADHGVTPFPERSRAEGHRDAQRVNVDSVITDVAVRLRAVPGVARVDRPADLAKHDTTVAVVRRWVHQVPLDAGVELVATLKPYCIWVYANLPPIAAHGQPSDIDAHVPLILWGRALRRGVYQARVASVDIAPTLARLLGLSPAEPLDGRVLTAAIASPER